MSSEAKANTHAPKFHTSLQLPVRFRALSGTLFMSLVTCIWHILTFSCALPLRLVEYSCVARFKYGDTSELRVTVGGSPSCQCPVTLIHHSPSMLSVERESHERHCQQNRMRSARCSVMNGHRFERCIVCDVENSQLPMMFAHNVHESVVTIRSPLLFMSARNVLPASSKPGTTDVPSRRMLIVPRPSTS